MENNIILSIGALAYNNPEELKRSLLSILPQMQPGVEVVINDNSDNLEIETMIKKEFNSPQIRYFKNEINLGTDRNLILAGERSLGKYVWWFGDDAIEPGAISHILKALKKNPEVSLALVNHYVPGHKAALDLKEDKLLTDRNEVINKLANLLDFISSVIVKKQALVGAESAGMEKFMPCGYINLFLVMYILSGNGKFLYVNEPYVCMYPTPLGKHVYDGFYYFAVVFYETLTHFQDKFDKKAIRGMLAKNFGHVWRGTLANWLKGYDTPRGKLRTLFKFYWSFPEFYLAAPFFVMPKFMTRLAYFVYKKVLKRTYSTIK